MTNLVRLFDKSKDNKMTLDEIQDNLISVVLIMTSFYRKRDKLLKDISELHPKSSERQIVIQKVSDLEDSYRLKVAKLGARVNSLYRVRFSGEDAFYIYDFRTGELEKVAYG